MIDEGKTAVKEGGLKITDFDDLKLAFIDLLDKHNKLAASHSALLRETKRLRGRERTYDI